MFCLPPHSSHKTQPLDKGCFGPLKKFWKQKCYDYLTRNPGKIVTHFTFSQLFSRAWFKGMSQTNIMSGFSTTSIYPLNCSALLPECPPSSLCQRTGLNFISLFTPTLCRSSRRISEIHEELPLESSPVLMQEQHSWHDYDLPLCSKDLSVFYLMKKWMTKNSYK